MDPFAVFMLIGLGAVSLFCASGAYGDFMLKKYWAAAFWLVAMFTNLPGMCFWAGMSMSILIASLIGTVAGIAILFSPQFRRENSEINRLRGIR